MPDIVQHGVRASTQRVVHAAGRVPRRSHHSDTAGRAVVGCQLTLAGNKVAGLMHYMRGDQAGMLCAGKNRGWARSGHASHTHNNLHGRLSGLTGRAMHEVLCN